MNIIARKLICFFLPEKKYETRANSTNIFISLGKCFVFTFMGVYSSVLTTIYSEENYYPSREFSFNILRNKQFISFTFQKDKKFTMSNAKIFF